MKGESRWIIEKKINTLNNFFSGDAVTYILMSKPGPLFIFCLVLFLQ